MEKLDLTLEHLIEKLEGSRNEFDEVEKGTLIQFTEGNYLSGIDNIFVSVKDGIGVIPYETVYDTEVFITYDNLRIESAYLAEDAPEKIGEMIKRYSTIVELLKTTL